MKLQVFYSVANGGDGSAYPILFESEELANFDQETMEDSWGESCVGSFTFESDSPIKCLDKVVTKEKYLFEMTDGIEFGGLDSNGKSKLSKFIKKFFPAGVPDFTVQVIEKGMQGYKPAKGYKDNNIIIDGKVVATIFTENKSAGSVIEKLLKDTIKECSTSKKRNK